MFRLRSPARDRTSAKNAPVGSPEPSVDPPLINITSALEWMTPTVESIEVPATNGRFDSARTLPCNDSLLLFLSDKFPATLGMLRKAGGVPSSAERLDQLDSSNHSTAEDIHCRNFV